MNEKDVKARETLNIESCPCEEDEIDLRELFAIIKKRKSIIIATTVVVLAIAIVYILIAKPLYEARATLEIGHQIIKAKSGQVTIRYFDQAERIKQYIDTKYDTAGKYRKKGIKAFIDKVEIPRKANHFVTITSYGLNNKLAVEKLKEALNDILSLHKLQYDAIIENTNDLIAQKEREIKYDNNTLLSQLRKKLDILKTTDLKNLDTKINLVKLVDLKKIDDNISFLKNVTIPHLEEKISKSKSEIKRKTNTIKSIQKEIHSIGQNQPSLAAIETMQVANLQNDIDRLNMRILDLQLQIKQILDQEIPNLEKQKQKILKEKIPNLLAQKEKLLKETIPSVEGNIKKLSNIIIPEIKAEIVSLKMSISPAYLVKTHIVGKIYTHDYPVKPKKKLIIVVALVTGLMLGLFLAFFVEYIRKEEKQG